MVRRHLKTIGFGLALSAAIVSGCTRKKAELGSKDNPVKFFFVPSIETQVLEDSSKQLKAYLEQHTPYHYQISIPTSYIAVVEAFGSSRADVASLNAFGYILAHQKYGAQARLTVIRHGESTYRSQIITHVDSGIRSIQDINGRRVAYVDPTSTSGYLMALKLFRDNGIKPKETVFAQRHDNVVSMIYQKQVDAGATFYSPPIDGKIQDARRFVQTQYPDVESKVVVLQLTDAIPNDPIVFRKDLPPEMVETIIKGLENYVASKEGKSVIERLLAVTGFKRVTDADYDDFRKLLKSLDQDADSLMQNQQDQRLKKSKEDSKSTAAKAG